MKSKILVMSLALVMLITGIAPTTTASAATSNGTLQVACNPNVSSITITYGSTTNTYTSTAYISIPVGTTVTWTAVTATGYEIEGGNSGSFVMTSYYQFTPSAVKITTYPLTITVDKNVSSISVTIDGTTTKYTSSTVVNVKQGASVSWTATAATGYNLSASSGNFTMTTALSICPTASIKTFAVTVTVNTGVEYVRVNGVRYDSSTTLTLGYGDSVTWEAGAETGYTLSSTKGSFTVTSAQTIAPTATLNSYVLTVTLNTGVQSIAVKYGSSTKTFTSSGTLSVSYGTSVSWTATAKSGYKLSATSDSFTMTAAKTIAPTASEITYLLTITVDKNVSSISVTIDGTTTKYTSSTVVNVKQGASVSWTATAATGYNLSESSGSFTMTTALSICPTASIKTFAVTVTVNTGVEYVRVNGVRYDSSTTLTLGYGDSVTWEAGAETGYTLSSTKGSFTVTSAQTIAPTATLNSYVLTVTLNTGVQSIAVKYGSATKTFTSSGTLSVSYGTSVSWTATAKSGYKLSATSDSFTMTAAKTIAPTASEITYLLTITVDKNVSSISVTIDGTTTKYTSSTVVNVKQGASVSWTATAATGYNLSASSGNFTMTTALSIYPSATVKSFTVSIVSYTPTNAVADFSWNLQWTSGKALTGAVSDYVTMTVASDGMSVTLTFKKDFSGGEMVLTCCASGDPNVKATCKVTCGS